MATIYYECGIPATLIPVEFIGWSKTPAHDVTGQYNAVIRLKKSHGSCYQKGEVLHLPSRCIVEKAGKSDYFIMVRQAALPDIDKENLIPCQW